MLPVPWQDHAVGGGSVQKTADRRILGWAALSPPHVLVYSVVCAGGGAIGGFFGGGSSLLRIR